MKCYWIFCISSSVPAGKICVGNFNKQESGHRDNTAIRFPTVSADVTRMRYWTYRSQREWRQEFNSFEYLESPPSITFPSEPKLCHMPTSVSCNWKQFMFFSRRQQSWFFFLHLLFSQDRIIISSTYKPKPSIHCPWAFKSIKSTFWTISGNVTFVPLQHNLVTTAQYFRRKNPFTYVCMYTVFLLKCVFTFKYIFIVFSEC